MSIKHHYEIHADSRSLKIKAKKLLADGLIPGIIYNVKESDGIPLTIKYNTIATKISDPSLLTRVIKISLDGVFYDAMIKEILFDPIKSTVVHIDFMSVFHGSTVKVNVPIKAVNQDKCPGIKVGGDYFVVQYSTPIIGPVENIPNHIDVDLTGKRIGDKILTSDVVLNSSCKFLKPGLLVRVSGKRVIEDKVQETQAQSSENSSQSPKQEAQK